MEEVPELNKSLFWGKVIFNVTVFSGWYYLAVQHCPYMGESQCWLQLDVNFISHNKHINLLFLYFQLGEGAKKCIRYWPDDEISHEHIHVKYIQSESCPYYTRRELNVANTKVSLTFRRRNFLLNFRTPCI